MEEFSGNAPGTGGLVTFRDSSWFMSVVVPYQPYFLDLPATVNVSWGYALFPNNPGDHVPKKMAECTGEEILMELCSHLRFTEHLPRILETSTCIPCMMPYVTSQFLARKKGNRPLVVPHGATNFAFLGQYCEIPHDVVFTVEYSVRAAQMAVYTLLNIDKKVALCTRGCTIRTSSSTRSRRCSGRIAVRALPQRERAKHLGVLTSPRASIQTDRVVSRQGNPLGQPKRCPGRSVAAKSHLVSRKGAGSAESPGCG